MIKPEEAPVVPVLIWDETQGILVLQPEDEWITLAQAGRIMGMTRQNAHLMARDGKFGTLHTTAEATIYMIRRSEALELAAKRSSKAESK